MQNFVDYLLENNVISPFSSKQEKVKHIIEDENLFFSFCPELESIECLYLEADEDEDIITEFEIGKYQYKINGDISSIYIYIIKFFNDVDLKTYVNNPELFYIFIPYDEYGGLSLKKSTQISKNIISKKNYDKLDEILKGKKGYGNLDDLLRVKYTYKEISKIILEIPSMSYILK